MSPIRAFAFVLACTLLLTAHGASAQTFPFAAQATWYEGIDGGNCSFGTIDTVDVPFGLIAAVGSPLYADSAACGRFIEIDTTGATCPGPPCGFTGERVVVMISDQLFSAQPDLDLSNAAFGALADPVAGLLQNVHWRFVPGTHPGNIQLVSTAGMNPWFLHFVLHDHNLGITQVEIRDAGSPVWRVATRDSANQWAVTSSGGAFVAPLSVRVTDVDGGVVTAIDAVGSLAANTSHDLGVQMATPIAVPSGSLVGPLAAALLAAAGSGVLWRRSRGR